MKDTARYSNAARPKAWKVRKVAVLASRAILSRSGTVAVKARVVECSIMMTSLL